MLIGMEGELYYCCIYKCTGDGFVQYRLHCMHNLLMHLCDVRHDSDLCYEILALFM